MNPIARQQDVLATHVGDDLLVHDQERDRTHALNAPAAFIFRQADGTRSVDELAVQLAHALALPADRAIVEVALAQLDRARLLERPDGTPLAHAPGVSRREVVRRLGLAALAMPLVTSIATPTPLMAQSASGRSFSVSSHSVSIPSADEVPPTNPGGGQGRGNGRNG